MKRIEGWKLRSRGKRGGFWKKEWKERTDLTQEEEIQKNEKSKDKNVLKKGGWEEKRINTVAYSQLKSIPSMDF